MKYNNIVLIFPTISLLTENLQKIMDNNLDYFSDYNKITLSEETMQEKNILIFTPERFMTFIDKNPNAKFDFVFIDACKREYVKYFEMIKPHLTPKALIVADNIISHAEKVQDFIDAVDADDEFQYEILEVPGGILVAYRC